MSEAARPGGTYETLDEQRERLSPAEERFERFRQTIGLFLGPIVFLVMYFIPLPLAPAQQALAAIFSFVIIYWLTEPIPIPVTAVLALAMCVLFGVAGAEAVFGAFSSDTIFLFIGAFIIAQAMMTHRLDRRFAFRVLSIPGVANSTYSVIIAFGAIAMAISAFISNTATTAMLLPIGLGMMAALGGLVADQAEGDDDAVGRVTDAGDGEHPEGEPPVEPVGHHGLGDDERPDEQKDRVGCEGPEDSLRPGHPEEHAHSQTQYRRHRNRNRLREPVDDNEGEDRRQGLLRGL